MHWLKCRIIPLRPVQTVPTFAPTFAQHLWAMLYDVVRRPFKRSQYFLQHSPNIYGPCCMMLCGGRSNGPNIFSNIRSTFMGHVVWCCAEAVQTVPTFAPTFFNSLRENWEREPGSLRCVTRVSPYCEVIKQLQHDPTLSRTKEMLERCWSKVWSTT